MPTSLLSDRPRLRLLLDHQGRVADYERRFGFHSGLMRSLVRGGTLPVDREIAAWLATLEVIDGMTRAGGRHRR